MLTESRSFGNKKGAENMKTKECETIEIEKSVLEFYRRALLGEKYQAKDRSTIFDSVYNRCWRIVARNLSGEEKKNIEKIKTELRRELQKQFKGKKIDKKILKRKDLGLRLGMLQKIFNMFNKYLYTFQDVIEIKNKNFDFSICDCPIDQTILKKLKEKKPMLEKDGFAINSSNKIVDRENPKGYCWTELTDIAVYENIQKFIGKIKGENKTRLEFDFNNWD